MERHQRPRFALERLQHAREVLCVSGKPYADERNAGVRLTSLTKWRNAERMTLAEALFIMSGCAASLTAQSSFHARIQILLGGDEPLRSTVRSCLSQELEKVDGVTAVGKQPDYFLAGQVIQYGTGEDAVVAVSAVMVEFPEKTLADRMLIRSDFHGELENAGALVASLGSVGLVSLKIGPLNSLPALCSEMVRSINATTLEDERLHPRGEQSFDAVYRNFLLRMGAKPLLGR